MPITKEILAKYKTHTFVETGCRKGGSASMALAVGFERVITCDINPTFAERCRNKFAGQPVEVFLGDSGKILPDLLEAIGGKDYVLFLDAHQNGLGDTGDGPCPLVTELGRLQDYTQDYDRLPRAIIIDDIDCARSPELRQRSGFPTSEEVVNAVLAVSSRYRFELHAGLGWWNGRRTARKPPGRRHGVPLDTIRIGPAFVAVTAHTGPTGDCMETTGGGVREYNCHPGI